MSKKSLKRTIKGLSPKPVVKQDDTVFIVREDLDEEQERLKTETAAETGALKAPAPTPAAEQAETAAASSKPLAPLAALWPSSVPPQLEANPSQTPAPPKAPFTATTPTASAIEAPPSPKPSSQQPTAPKKATVLAQAVKSTAPQSVKVTFVLFEPKAKQVSLCGEFNRWASDATPMKRQDGGVWETTVALAPGRYEYKFIADGQWIPDPLAREQVWNRHGSLNSVIEVRA